MITCNYFCFRELIFWRLQLQLRFLIPSRKILEKCNGSWGKPSDYNYISEFQEQFILQKLHLQSHFLICQEFKL